MLYFCTNQFSSLFPITLVFFVDRDPAMCIQLYIDILAIWLPYLTQYAIEFTWLHIVYHI